MVHGAFLSCCHCPGSTTAVTAADVLAAINSPVADFSGAVRLPGLSTAAVADLA